MTSPAARFYARVKVHVAKESDLLDFFVYHITIELQQPAATTKAVKECYTSCDMVAPSWLAPHLSNGLTSKPRRFIKVDGGYRLESRRREEIAALLDQTPKATQVSASLDRLEAHVPAGPKREFLHETILCYGVGANRAAVVMCWNLALHHLQDHVMADAQRLAAFNGTLALNKDSRVKIKVIAKQDDFTEMPESKFLLFCREAKIVTGGMYNKLDGRLDERNTAAHPSGVKVGPRTAEAYIEDLVDNVVLKYPA